jgi:hypothetical protein
MENDLWLEEEEGWSNLQRYINGTVMNSMPEWTQ